MPMTPEDLQFIDFPPATDIHAMAAKDGGVLVLLDYPPDLEAVANDTRQTFILRWDHEQLKAGIRLFERALEAFPDVQPYKVPDLTPTH